MTDAIGDPWRAERQLLEAEQVAVWRGRLVAAIEAWLREVRKRSW